MKWFSGSIPDAVQTAKSTLSVFVVYITGSDDLSKEMDKTWDDQGIENLCQTQNWVILKLEANSEACAQFSQIYPVVCVPCTFFIGPNGTPLEVTAGPQSAEVFLQTLAKVQKLHRSLDSTGAQPTQSAVQPTQSPPESSSTSSPSSSSSAAAAATSQNDANLYSSDDNDQASTSSETSQEQKDRIAKAQALIQQKRVEKAKKAEEEQKRKEIERRQLGQNLHKLQDWKEEQNHKETISSWKKEKEEDKKARERVREQIARDKADRAARANQEREERETVTQKPSTSTQSTVNKDIARLQFRLPDGSSVTEQFPSSQPLQHVYNYVQQKMGSGLGPFTLATVFPRCQFTEEHHRQSLLDLDLAPAAVLMVLPGKGKPQQKSDPSDSSSGLLSYIWILVGPLVALWSFIVSFVTGGGRGNQGAVASVPSHSQGTSSEQSQGGATTSTSGPSSANRRPKSSYGLRSRQEGNVRRLTNQDDDDDDESATWNGNSTQQM